MRNNTGQNKKAITFESNRLGCGNTILSFLFILVFILPISTSLKAQFSLHELIESTKANNKTLAAAARQYEADVITARTGNSPDNPEIEYAYLWGSPENFGDRVDFGVSQTFDFPTTYSSRARLSRITRDQAFLKFRATRQTVLTNARSAWVNAVYLNQKREVVSRRLENARLIAEAVRQAFEEGETNQMDLNQALLRVTSLQNEMYRLQADLTANRTRITRLNGGIPFAVEDTLFPQLGEIGLDSLVVMYQNGPLYAAYLGEVDRREQQKNVIFNQKLPKLMAGYYEETMVNGKQAGFRAGITIPLWENARAVKSAKANLVFAASDAERYWLQQETDIRRMHEQYTFLNEQLEGMREMLSTVNSDELLLKALEGGEISLTEYYYESDFLFQTRLDYIDLERDVHLLEAEMLRVTY